MIDAAFVLQLLADGATAVPCTGGALVTPVTGSPSIFVPSTVMHELIASNLAVLDGGVYRVRRED